MASDTFSLMKSYLREEDTTVVDRQSLARQEKFDQKRFETWMQRIMEWIVTIDPYSVPPGPISRHDWVYELRQIRHKNKDVESLSQKVCMACFEVIDQLMHNPTIEVTNARDHYKDDVKEERLMHTLLHLCVILDPDTFRQKIETVSRIEYPIFHQHVATVQFVHASLFIRKENILPTLYAGTKYSIDNQDSSIWEGHTWNGRNPGIAWDTYLTKVRWPEATDTRTPSTYFELVQQMIKWLDDTTKDPSSKLLNLMWIHNDYIHYAVTREREFFHTVSGPVFKQCHEVCENLLRDYDSMLLVSDLRRHSLMSMIMSIGVNIQRNSFVIRPYRRKPILTLKEERSLSVEGKKDIQRKNLYIDMINRQCKSLRQDCADMYLCKELTSPLAQRRLVF
jgi:hypothetical protein